MKQHEKLLLCETLYLVAYGYILNGYTAAAIFLAVIPLFIMILEHSLEDLLKHYLSFLFFSGLFLYFSYIYRIEESYKGFSFILLLHISTCSFMTSYSFSALRYFLKINFYLSPLLSLSSEGDIFMLMFCFRRFIWWIFYPKNYYHTFNFLSFLYKLYSKVNFCFFS